MSSLTNRAIEVVDEAATETVIFNAEKQMEIHQQARKHQRIIETPEVLANVIVLIFTDPFIIQQLIFIFFNNRQVKLTIVIISML
ncbi:hypothetical protein RMATCC62417_08545 [Rhizopus microsporus]|nr:hypothetical protein RMATCC62417_08545 [Rhizopus microsporus]